MHLTNKLSAKQVWSAILLVLACISLVAARDLGSSDANASAATSGGRAWMPRVCGQPPLVQHPSLFSFSCDGHIVVNQIHWRRWGEPTATADATIFFGCTRDCQPVPLREFPAKVIVTRIVACGDRRTYSRIVAAVLGSAYPAKDTWLFDEPLMACNT